MLVILYITLLWFSAINAEGCFKKEKVTMLQKAMCQCCNQTGNERRGCSQEMILMTLKRKGSCLNDLNDVYNYKSYNRRESKIYHEDFLKWCRIIMSSPGAALPDMFALAITDLKWNSSLREVMLRSVIKVVKVNKKFDFTVEDLIEKDFVDFFIKLFDTITKHEEYMSFCLLYIYDCRDIFSAYIDGLAYKGCSSSDVKDIIGSIIDGLPKKDLILQRLSPKEILNVDDHGLLSYFCSTAETQMAKYKIRTNWSMIQMKQLFFHTAKFNWPLLALETFLELDKSKIEPYTSKYYFKRKRNDKNWDLGDIVKIVNKVCILLTEEDGLEKYMTQDIEHCLNTVMQITGYSADFFNLTGRGVYHLLTYNFFTLKHRLIFGIPEEKKLESPKDLYEFEKVMLKLIKYKTSSSSDPIPFISKEMITYDNGLGVTSVINLLLLNEFYKISEENLEKIHLKLKEIPLMKHIDSDERKFNEVDKDECDGKNSDYPLCKFRRQLGYRPVYRADLRYQLKKTWGKVVFVAIHATSYRVIGGLITVDKYTDELIKCLDDIISSTSNLPTYCGIFNVNPYFGEFENVIELYPIKDVLITV